MAFFILKDKKWFDEHGETDPVSGGMVCRRTGAPIQTLVIGRSIHQPLFPGAGFGDVWNVHHIFCTGCTPNFTGPEVGTPIVADELYEVRADGRVYVLKSLLTGDVNDSFDWVTAQARIGWRDRIQKLLNMIISLVKNRHSHGSKSWEV